MKKIKMILPVLAFLFAIIGAFATVSTTEAKSALAIVDVSLPSPSVCAKVGTCNEIGQDLCENNDGTTMIRYNGGTSCGAAFNGQWQ